MPYALYCIVADLKLYMETRLLGWLDSSQEYGSIEPDVLDKQLAGELVIL